MITRPVTVVIADDDHDIRALVAIAVKRAGFVVQSAHGDGLSAWESIEQRAPQVVVLDVSMPGYTGLELTTMMRSNPACATTRIVLLSAGADLASRERADAAGADLYLTKPFSPKALAEHLQEVMR